MMSKSLRMTSPICISAAFSVLALVAVTFGAGAESDVEPRGLQKRGLLQLCNMMETYTTRDCLKYNDYGCFCGSGHTGNTTVDAIDDCCRSHDRCYARIDCNSKFATYSYKCSGGSCICREKKPALVFWTSSKCAYNTCKCDLEFAQCLGRTDVNYSKRFKGYDKKQCI